MVQVARRNLLAEKFRLEFQEDPAKFGAEPRPKPAKRRGLLATVKWFLVP